MAEASGTAGWRAMRPADLPAITAISDTAHGRYAESEATYAERLALHPIGCLVFERDGVIAGYLISHPWRRLMPPALNEHLVAIPTDSDTYYLHDIALSPAARGSGAGKAALAFVIDRARALGLADVTLMAVNGADSYWASRGFAYVETDLQGSYGADSYVMRLDLGAD